MKRNLNTENIFRQVEHIFESTFTLLKILIKSSYKVNLPCKNHNYSIILGNGPSLSKKINTIQALRNQCDVFCVNGFPSTEHFIKLKPNHFVIVSREYYFPDYSRIREQTIREQIISDLIKKTTWKLNFFIPFEAKKNRTFLSNISQNQFIQPVYYNTTPIEGFHLLKQKLMEMGLGLPRPHNVLIPTIYLSTLMNYKYSFLYGADHSWLPQIHVTEENQALISQKHFYDEQSAKARTMHLKGNSRKLHEILHKFYLTFYAYHELKKYAANKEIKIYNCSEGSFIDAFDRLSSKQVSSIIE